MTLELYHHGSSVCAAKVRIVLEEKGLDYEKHYLDILKGDQFDPAYMKLNPKAVVPTLVHDGHVVTESTVICEYLDWVWPAPAPLIPADPLQRAEMLYWTKLVDEELHPACGALTFTCSHRYTILRMGEKKVEEFLNATPPISLSTHWRERKRRLVREGLAAPEAADAVNIHEIVLTKMEKALAERPYLAGEAYTLADVALIPYANRLRALAMLEPWCAEKPGVLDWFGRMQARPMFHDAIDKYLPEDLAEDLRTNGAKSWPEVEKLLEGVRAG